MSGADRPPRVLASLARILLPAEGREFILGDLTELFARRAGRDGRWSAAWRYGRDLLVSAGSRRFRSLGGRPLPERRGGGGLAGGWLTDVRAAARALRREPGFVALTAFTLALGIGSTAAMFGMVNQLLLRPLPGVGADPGAAYLTLESASNPRPGNPMGLATVDFDAFRTDAGLLEGIASYGWTNLTLSRAGSRPISLSASTIYGDYFEVLGVRPAEGRLLSAAEMALHADPLVAVISEKLRASLFPPGEEVVGRTLLLNGHSVQIVGVAGGGFAGPERGQDVDVWVPYGALVPLLGFPAETLRSLNSTMHNDLVVRLRDGVTPEAAEAGLGAVLSGMASRASENADYLGDLRPVVYPGLHLPPLWRDRTYGTLRLLGGVVLVVLLIACANVANLLLVRNVKRRGMLATQRAIGASPGRIARQQLFENLLLGLVGTSAGLAAAWLIALPFRGDRLIRLPAFEGFTIDTRVLVFASVAAIVTAILFGTLPAVLAGRFDLTPALKSGGRQETGRATALRAALSAGQIALSIALLIGGLLLTRTVRNLYAVDTGIDIANVLWLPVETQRGIEGAAAEALHRRLIAAVERVPGVERVALDLYGPHGSRMFGRISLPGAGPDQRVGAAMSPVTPGWFELFGVEMIRGRAFRPDDWRSDLPPRVILTAALARRLFGTEDAVGRRVMAGTRGEHEAEVVGVTRELRMASAPDEPHEAFYMPFQAEPGLPFLSLFVRRRALDATTAVAVRTAVESVLPEQPVPNATPLTDRVDAIHSERRILSRLIGLLSTMAVLLAAVGLYGVIAFAVAGRRREFGIRMALGARTGRIAGLVARYAAAVIGAGLAAGLLIAWSFSRVLDSRLFGVTPTEPAVYALAAAAFAAIAAAACWRPVQAATRVDPIATLREE